MLKTSPPNSKRTMWRTALERSFFFPPRFRWTTIVKCFLLLAILYLFNVLTGVQYYLWSERSFQNDYPLSMTRIDLSKIDEDNPEKALGAPKFQLGNTFLITNEHLCSNRSEPHLLILVKSAVDNRQARQAIRMTWAKKEFLAKNSIRVAFVLGTTTASAKENPLVDKESQEYGDLIQIDKLDYYYHNSYKMVMMLRWINTHCTSASSAANLRTYALFIDDDYYLDLNSLLTYLTKVDQDPTMSVEQRRTFLTGYVYRDSRPRRFLNDRWYISIDEYPYDRYPPYVTAGCFLMSRSNARLFHIASQYIRLFRFDDIYMGLLAYAMSIEPVPNNELFSAYDASILVSQRQSPWWTTWKQYFSNQIDWSSSPRPICVHGYRGEHLLKIWNEIHLTNLTLPVVH